MSPQTEPEPPPDEIPAALWRAASEAAARAPDHITLRGVVYAALLRLTRQFPPPVPPSPTPPLPELRAQVAELTRQGMTADTIAARLSVSARTVKRHRAYTNTNGRHFTVRGPIQTWTAAEDVILADTRLTGPQAAALLGRPVEAVYRRRSEKGIHVS